MNLSRKLKAEILQVILSQDNPFGNFNNYDIVDFISRIWDLRNMPSTDGRYNNAYDDAVQHLINNDDWDYQFLFEERLGVLENDSSFKSFLEAILSPDIRNTEDEIMKYFLLLNPYLEKERYGMYIADYTSSGFPIYTTKLNNEVDPLPIGLMQNKIPFHVEFEPFGRSNHSTSHQTPTITPSFVLAFNSGWNDFGLSTTFDLYYYPNTSNYYQVGEVKIFNDQQGDITTTLERDFTVLNGNYCSLGQSIDYYMMLKSIFGKNFESVLWALKDAAFFPEIQEKFEQHSTFKNSLIRYNEQEQLLREAKYRIYDYDLSNLYSFKYSFSPKFSDSPVDIDFNFGSTGIIPSRIYAIIGKNGTGKTQLMTSLPIDIYKKNDNNFMPKAPLFSKVISVSYSAFDNFEIPKKTASFNYLYCGLKDENGESISERSLILRFHNTWKEIRRIERLPVWVKILENFIDREILNLFISQTTDEITVHVERFTEARKRLSSGQSILLYIISDITANIRYDSIILYDEPETHLHPNAISQLMNTIFELVNEFQSYCIVATHSPLIIRELLARNVFIIEKEGTHASVRKIGIETFGENLTVLTEEVFGNRSIPKQYKVILDSLVERGLSYQQILDQLESSEMPLSLNARMYIKSITNEKP